MLGIHLTGAQMDDVDQAVRQFAELDGVLHGIAAHAVLIHGVDDLQRRIGAHRVPDGLIDLQHKFAAALYALRAVLVGAVVCQR